VHDGCSGSFTDGKGIVDKLRMMGFNLQPMPGALTIDCHNCQTTFQMTHFEFACPDCRMVYGVTPCHSTAAEHVKAAGIGY